jgi:hypothetical protein
MAFGHAFAQKPRKRPVAADVRPVTGALVRIVVLALFATIGAGWGIWAYYTHVFRVKPRPVPSASASASTEIEVEVR